ncbi:MAG: hypothetical protein WBV69_11680 [Candidatus Sulfotelmatobacter sp.]
MRRITLGFILCFCVNFAQSARSEVIPAGTLLQCTLSEPNFSSKTATVGDPVLCHIGSLSDFGHSSFLRDAELGGHLRGYKNPGRLIGKGWLDVQFDQLVLSGEHFVPISAKVISAPNARVDREGKIHGRGHAKRGAIEWMIPVFWPIYPAFKGETRLTLRVLEDVQIQPSVAATVSASALPSRGTAGSQAYPEVYPVMASASDARITLASISAYRTAGFPQPTLDQGRNQRSTLIVLKDGAAYVARQYWVEDGQMRCTGDNGEERGFTLESIDLDNTVRLNRERNVEFIVQSKNYVVEEQ